MPDVQNGHRGPDCSPPITLGYPKLLIAYHYANLHPDPNLFKMFIPTYSKYSLGVFFSSFSPLLCVPILSVTERKFQHDS